MTKKEKILLFILAGINFTHIMDFMIMMPLQEYLVPEFHITPRQFSWLVSAYGFAAGASSIIASFFTDRFDRKRVLLFAYTGFIAGTFACAFAPTFLLLMISRVIAGTFGGLIGAQVLSIVGDTFPFERRGFAMGTLMGSFAVASVIGMPTGLYFAAELGWHIPFAGIGVLGLLVTPLVIAFIPKMTGHLLKEHETGRRSSIYHDIARDRNLRMGLLMMFTMILSHFSIIPFIAPYLENNVGFTKNQIALMYFVGGVVSMISSPLIGRLADRFGKFRILAIFLVLSVIPVFLITNMPRIPFYYVLIVTALFFIFAGGRMIPAQSLITSVVTPQQRGSFMNVNSALQQFSTALGAYMAGLIVYKNSAHELVNYQKVGYIGIAISFICLFFAAKVRPVGRH